MQGIPLTLDQKQKFLARLRSARGNVSRACKAIGISRAVAYIHKKDDADFSGAWEQVLAALVDEAEQELHIRAVKGWREPVVYKGEVVKGQSVIKKSDRLLEFFLKGNRPEKYRERIDLSATHTGSLDVALQASIDKVYADDQIPPNDIDDLDTGLGTGPETINDDEPTGPGPAHAGAALYHEDDLDGESRRDP